MLSYKRGVAALIWSSVDKILTNGVALIISIILARLIEPSEYGVIATANIFTVILSLFVEPGMTSALIQKKTSDRLDFSTILSFNIVVGTGLYLLLFCLSGVISQWFDLPILSPVIKVLGLQIVIGSVNSVQIAYVQKNMLFKRYFICSFTSVIVSAIIGIIMAYKGAGVWALVIYNLVKQFINTLMTFLLFQCRFGLNFSKKRFKEMFPFAGKMLFTKFIDQGYVETTQTIISKVYSSTELAFYNKGKSFPDLIISNLNSALSSVMFPYFSSMQDNFGELKKSLRTSIQMTSYICIPMMVGLLACADNFIDVVLTHKWIDSVPFLQLFCFYYIWVPFSNVIWQSLKAIGKSDVVLKLEIIKMLLNLTSLVFFLTWIKSPIAVAISIAFSYMVSFFVECYMASHHLRYSVKEIIADFVPSFVLSWSMGGIVFALDNLTIPTIVCFVLQVLCGILFYAILTSLLRFPQIEQIFSMLKQKRNKGNNKDEKGGN